MADVIQNFDDGKYTLIRRERVVMEALRYGSPWRDLTGDNLIFAMSYVIEEAQAELTELRAEVSRLDALNSECTDEIIRLGRIVARLREPVSFQESVALWKISENEKSFQAALNAYRKRILGETE